MSNRLFQGGASPCLMISNSNQLLIGTPEPFSTALQQALAQGYGAQCVHTVTDIPPVAPGLEHLRPSTVYLVTNAFLVADTEHPARRWHQHIRELLKDLNLARRYGFAFSILPRWLSSALHLLPKTVSPICYEKSSENL